MKNIDYILMFPAILSMAFATILQYKNKFNAPILIVSYLLYVIVMILKIDDAYTGEWMKAANRILNIGMGIGWYQFFLKNKHFYRFSDTVHAKIIYSVDSEIKWANKEACDLFGMHKRDMIGNKMNTLIMDSSDSIFHQKRTKSRKELETIGASVFTYSRYLNKKTNKTFTATRLLKCEKDDTGKVVSIIAEIIKV